MTLTCKDYMRMRNDFCLLNDNAEKLDLNMISVLYGNLKSGQERCVACAKPIGVTFLAVLCDCVDTDDLENAFLYKIHRECGPTSKRKIFTGVCVICNKLAVCYKAACWSC